MENLKKTRTTIKSFFTRLETYLNEIDTTTEVDVIQIQVRLEKLETNYQIYIETQERIDVLTAEPDLDLEYRTDIEDKYFRIKSKCLKLITENTTSNHEQASNSSSIETFVSMAKTISDTQVSMTKLMQDVLTQRTTITNSNQNSSDVDNIENDKSNIFKLPKINIPEFTGEAASTLKHLRISDANYAEAWDELQTKYGNEKYIIDAHLSIIFDQPVLPSPVTVSSVRKLTNTTRESFRALRALNLPIEHWDCILNFMLVNKLDPESKLLWARTTAKTDRPKFDELLSFLDRREFELQSLQHNKKPNQNYKNKEMKQILAVSINSCLYCKETQHTIYKCSQFKSLNSKQRKTFATNNSLCINCLRNDHFEKECKSGNCRVCRKRHHTMLHDAFSSESQQIKKSNQSTSQTTPVLSATILHTESSYNTTTLLPTAIVLVKNSSNQFTECRALLDSESQTSLITESCVQKLGLSRTHSRLPVSGVGSDNHQHTRGSVNLVLKSRHSYNPLQTVALILPKLSNLLPARTLRMQHLEGFKNLVLADEKFYEPKHIDILIGSDLFFNTLREGRIQINNGIIAQNTIFGYVIGGNFADHQSDSPQVLHVALDTDHLLQRFWETEELNSTPVHLTEEESLCEENFQTSHYRQADGRFVVNLPFKQNSLELGESRTAALTMLRVMEKRFERDNEFAKLYRDFMDEYIRLGHMRAVDKQKQQADKDSYYIPHHAVLKSSSSTTKLRVVFNASKPTSTGISLNNKLLVGPTVQNDIISILMRFRLHKIAFSADIIKMYRQVYVNDQHVRFQRILWRTNPTMAVQEYELRTVTYGTTSAPYLATRSLNQLAIDNSREYPTASKILVECCYVDDIMSGCNNTIEAINTIHQIKKLVNLGKFELHKWSSNCRELLEEIPESERETQSVLSIDDIESSAIVKTLGLHWDTSGDYFFFRTQLATDIPITKRLILSTISKIFDPVGWLSPSIITTKILLQKLWILGVSWDEELPSNLTEDWTSFYKDLSKIQQIKIPRWTPYNHDQTELHVFADASERAYAAAAYLKTTDDLGHCSIHLIAAKTRVAPIKQISLPRLEICAAHLTAKLATKVRTSLHLEDVQIYGWTDSQIVLAWLADHPKRWHTFIGNRTSEILSVIPRSKWHHVKSSQNPCDCASRGIMPNKLVNHELWWQGPSFLKTDSTSFLSETIIVPDTSLEQRKVVMHTIVQQSSFLQELLNRFSSLSKLKRVTARCLRLRTNRRLPKDLQLFGPLNVNELQSALRFWIHFAQSESFGSEIQSIQQSKPLPKRSLLATLNPFIDKAGILRVDGRLHEAKILYDQKHPIILPTNHRISEMIIDELHVIHLHASQRLIQSICYLKYWIIGARQLIKRIVYKCTRCIRFPAQTQPQQLGRLPKVRITPSRPFQNTGVDYAGPIMVRSWKGRGSKTYKTYIALFICMTTKAVHLELVSSLSSDDFIAALKRFFARRGLSSNIYSDNGTAFIGANRQLKELGMLLKSQTLQNKLKAFAAEREVNFHFIPPSAPNFGGIWESGVKLVKFHLRRQVLRNSSSVIYYAHYICG